MVTVSSEKNPRTMVLLKDSPVIWVGVMTALPAEKLRSEAISPRLGVTLTVLT